MKHVFNLFTLGLTILSTFQVNAKQNYLQECWEKQVKLLQGQYLTFSYQEKLNKLEHNFEPWQQTNYIGKGTIWSNVDNFWKQDTLINGNRTYFSKTSFNKTELLFLDYGDKDLYAVTQDMFLDQTIKTARYLPVNVINYFVRQRVTIDNDSDKDFAIYETRINKTIVKLFIRKTDYLLQKVTALNHHNLFGDVLSTFTYSDYSILGSLHLPKNIQIDKINGKVKGEVLLSNIYLTKVIPKLLDKPTDYKLTTISKIIPRIKTDKYNDNIHFIELIHTDDKVMVVEFADFLLVAEAPINSENGELIISETKKIAPNKPIKYFLFGHHHPHYLGGIRAFIHKGAKIICSDINVEYVKYIANASHTLNPDSLQIEPKTLQIENIKKNLTISDGIFEMKIYFIGGKSKHTNDYLIYYFPNEKLLFEDDLIWIAKKGEIKKAGRRQAGLYNSIKELGLDVETIIQSWPISDYGIKTIIPFKDLEKSMNIK